MTAPRASTALLGVAVAASAVTLLALQSGLTFFLDEWDFLAERRPWTASTFLEPHNEHISILPIAVYKVLVSVFGMESQRPFGIVLIVCVAANALLVFAWVRRRLGEWLALAATVPLLFLGSSAFNLLWPFQITLMGSLAFGIGALLALDRGDPGRDRLACGLLIAAVATNSVGVAFSIGAGAAVLAGPDRARRAYVFAVPLLAFAIWWVFWGESGGDALTAAKLLDSPGFVFDGFASSLASLLGLVTGLEGAPIDPLDWGRPLLLVALALAGWRLWRVRSVTPMLLAAITSGVAFWWLTAVSGTVATLSGVAGPLRTPTNGRYQFIGAVFAILIASELWRGSRPGPRAIAVALAVGLLALVGNLRAFDRSRDFLAGAADATRAQLGAGEVVDGAGDPARPLAHGMTLGSYLAARNDFGSPAFTEPEILDASESLRVAADVAAGSVLPVTVVAAPSDASRSPECRTTRVAEELAAVPLPRGGAVVVPDRPAAFAVRRYSSENYPVPVSERTPPGGVAILIPPDDSALPWTLGVAGADSVAVCPLAASGGDPGS